MFNYPIVGIREFHGIETLDMPKVHEDHVFRDALGNVYFSLKYPRSK